MCNIANHARLLYVLEDLMAQNHEDVFPNSDLKDYLEECRRVNENRGKELLAYAETLADDDSKNCFTVTVADCMGGERRIAFIEGFVSGVRLYREMIDL
jgi:hypothetical protein